MCGSASLPATQCGHLLRKGRCVAWYTFHWPLARAHGSRAFSGGRASSSSSGGLLTPADAGPAPASPLLGPPETALLVRHLSLSRRTFNHWCEEVAAHHIHLTKGPALALELSPPITRK